MRSLSSCLVPNLSVDQQRLYPKHISTHHLGLHAHGVTTEQKYELQVSQQDNNSLA